MEHYQIGGMHCAVCATRIEQAVNKVDGVNTCSVNLLTNSMQVEGTASREQIVFAVEQAGYRVQLPEAQKKETLFADGDTPVLKRKLLYSLIFLIPLFYSAMGHTMFHFPFPLWLEKNPVAIGILQMLLAIVILGINQSFFTNGFQSLLKKAPNMNTLIALGSGASFVYSVFILFQMTGEQVNGNTTAVFSYLHEFYFESSAMILVLITVGKLLEARSKGKTTNALKSLMDFKPQTAVLLVDGKETTVSADKIQINDIFVVKPGERIPIDGIILEGSGAVDQSALTGESSPVDKIKGDTVYAATINQSGHLTCQATKTSEETSFSQIIQMVHNAAATKAPIAKTADKISGIFVPIVISISILAGMIWFFSGATIGFAISRAISVLVISCPCALGLATPVAIMVGTGVAAKQGILFKTAASLEETGRIKIVALDKTGTITKGCPEVTDLLTGDGITQDELLSLAYSLERKSEHPLAKAIVTKATELSTEYRDVKDVTIHAGNGITATLQNKFTVGGNFNFVSAYAEIPPKAIQDANTLANQGKTPLYFALEKQFYGIIAIADSIKEDSIAAIRELQQMGMQVVMLTGDNSLTANALQQQIGVDEVYAELLPDRKGHIIQELRKRGKTAMVGDGINDAPALTCADTGIAIGAGTDVAIDAADVVLMKNSLSDIPAAIRISKAVLRTIHQNLFWAFLYNSLGIPLAAGLFIPICGLRSTPMFGAAAMSLSSFCVISNALRLNLYKFNKTVNANYNTTKENNYMEKTIRIDGMMCPHCEARVKKLLEEFDGVEQAVVSHEKGTAVLTVTNEIPLAPLKEAIENQGYTVLD